MDVDRSKLWNIQNLLREELAKRRRHAKIRFKGFKRRHAVLALDALRLEDRNAGGNSHFLDRAGGQLVAAALGPVRLAKDAHDVLAVFNQRVEGRYGKVRRTHKDDSQASSSASSSSAKISRDMMST